MENNQEIIQQTSLDYLYDKVLDADEYYNSVYRAFEEALAEAKIMYEKELEEAFKKGFNKGRE
jgi:hypothetical protein